MRAIAYLLSAASKCLHVAALCHLSTSTKLVVPLFGHLSRADGVGAWASHYILTGSRSRTQQLMLPLSKQFVREDGLYPSLPARRGQR